MKIKKIFYSAAIALLCFIIPLSAHIIGHEPDPLDESLIISSLEMETDTEPRQDIEAESSGDIIFDDSFDDVETQAVTRKRVSRKSETVINSLKLKDKRWHIVKYKIRANDSIWNIAKKFGTDSQIIIELNDIKKPGLIKKNRVILVPSTEGVYYTIKRGDTLTGISEKYSTAIDEIASHNNIHGSDIKAGRKIFIPGAVEKKETPVKTVRSRKTNNRLTADTGIKAGKKKSVKKKKPSGIVLSWPLRGPVTSGFGYRKDPFSGNRRFHCGMDIGAEIGTPIKAAGAGRVIFSGWKGAYGYLVVIAHDKNYITVYAHNSKNLVDTGETIKKGQVIALSGNTGAVTGPHLHFEIRKGTVPLNPRRLLKK